MIILHSHLQKESRDFVENHSQDSDTILDWYRGGREIWHNKWGESSYPSAFPSVVLDVPEYTDQLGEKLQKTYTTIRMPSTRQEVYDYVEDLNDRIKAIDISFTIIDLDGPRP